MDGLSLISHNDGQLRERLSLEIVRRRDFASLGSDGFDSVSLPVSGVARQFQSLRLAGCQSSATDVQSVSNVRAGSTGPAVHQFSVTSVDEEGHVHTSPLVTISLQADVRLQGLSHLGLFGGSLSGASHVTFNHAFLCMDVGNGVIGPRMVSFSGNGAHHRDRGVFTLPRNSRFGDPYASEGDASSVPSASAAHSNLGHDVRLGLPDSHFSDSLASKILISSTQSASLPSVSDAHSNQGNCKIWLL